MSDLIHMKYLEEFLTVKVSCGNGWWTVTKWLWKSKNRVLCVNEEAGSVCGI